MTEERRKQIKTILQARTSAINKTWLRATLEECVTALDPAPAVDWREVAEKLYYALMQYESQMSGAQIGSALAVYERALAAEAEADQERG